MAQTAASGEVEVVALSRVLLATVLLLAASGKLREWRAFHDVLRSLGLDGLRGGWITAFAAGVVGLEGALAGLLVTGRNVEAAAWGTTGFLCVATLALLILRRRGYEGGCGCFGEPSARRRVGWPDFVRNAALVTVSVGVLFAATGPGPVPPLWALPAATLALGAAATAGALLSYLMADAAASLRALAENPTTGIVEVDRRERPDARESAL